MSAGMKVVFENYRIGEAFEKLVGQPLSDFKTLAQIEEAVEKKLGRKLKPIHIDVEQQRRRADELIAQGERILAENFEP